MYAKTFSYLEIHKTALVRFGFVVRVRKLVSFILYNIILLYVFFRFGCLALLYFGWVLRPRQQGRM